MNYARFGSIYVATNMVTEEQYVGQTQQPLKTRVYAHMISALKPKFKFACAIAEYGFENFMFAEVAVAFDKAALNEIECAVITDLAPAYNITKGGSGRRGPTSETTRTKRSEAARQRWADPEWRARTTASIQKAAAEGKFDACGAQLAALGLGPKMRWAGHTKVAKTAKVFFDRSEHTRQSWLDPQTREARLDGARAANLRVEVIARRSAASRNREYRMSTEVVLRVAASKHKPVTCSELGVSFLSQGYAAEHLGVSKSAISQALRLKGKVGGGYTLVRVHN
jgi:group I intron endonuclease